VLQSKDGNTTIAANVQSTSVTGKDGTVTQTETFTVAGFSNKKGQEGSFVGAGQETVTTVTKADGTSTSSSSSKDISYGQAARTIGTGNLAEGVAYAAGNTASRFPHQVAQDVMHHPLGTLGVIIRSAAIPVAEVCPACARYMAIGGEALAVGDSAKDNTPYP
jgi:hypothetical protein